MFLRTISIGLGLDFVSGASVTAIAALPAAAPPVSTIEDAVVRAYDSYYSPKCYITYKKYCSYKKAVYGKCYKKECYMEQMRNRSKHDVTISERAAGEAIDLSVKSNYEGGKGKAVYSS